MKKEITIIKEIYKMIIKYILYFANLINYNNIVILFL